MRESVRLATFYLPKRDEFRHLEWYFDGIAGIETSIYLVVDPDDSLATAAAVLEPMHVLSRWRRARPLAAGPGA